MPQKVRIALDAMGGDVGASVVIPGAAISLKRHPDSEFLLYGDSKLIDEQQISNLRVMQHDATEVVRDMLAPDSLAGIHIFFPDPWPKKRHHKRRILQPAFVAELASRLAPGGYLHCATDWEEYAQFMLETLSAEPLLQNTATDYAPKPDYRPLTKFEARGLRLGHGVWDLVFKRI